MEKRFLLVKVTKVFNMNGVYISGVTPYGMCSTYDEASKQARELNSDNFEIYELKDDGTFKLVFSW